MANEIKLYTVHYNNYFNKRVLKESTLAGYLVNSYYTNGHLTNNVSFNENDGINTTQYVNYKPTGDNYAILVSYNTTTEVSTIISRWFIVDAQRSRTGQWNLNLKRDVIVDNYNTVLSAPAFIQKATLPVDSPLLYTNEGMTFNQIKKSETLLKDKSECPWLVAYYNNAGLTDKTLTLNMNLSNATPIGVPIAQWTYYNNTDLSQTGTSLILPYSNLDIKCTIQTYKPASQSSISGYYDVKYDQDLMTNATQTAQTSNFPAGYDSNKWNYRIDNYTSLSNNTRSCMNTLNAVYNNQTIRQALISGANTYTGAISQQAYEELSNLSVIVDSDGYYYKVSLISTAVYRSGSITVEQSGTTSALYSAMQTAILAAANRDSYLTGSSNTNPFEAEMIANTKIIHLERVASQEMAVTIDQNAYTPQGALYNIIAMPYGDFTLTGGDGTVLHNTKQMADAFAAALSTKVGSSALYDIQILPYCPVQELMDKNGYIDLRNYTKSHYYQTITLASAPQGIVFNVLYNTFSFDINKTLEVQRDYTIDDTAVVSATGSASKQFRLAAGEDGSFRGAVPIDLSLFPVNQNLDVTSYQDVVLGSVTVSNESIVQRRADEAAATIFWDFNGKPKSIIFYLTLTNDDPQETYPADVYTISVPVSATIHYNQKIYTHAENIDYKTSDACDIYRLNSPNFSSSFEFSVAKNGGQVSCFHVDCTYKPYTPYIQIAPDFQGLYGADFNDYRGLILAGDYSYGQLSSAWANYELSNKNYQSIFNREIQNMDVNNSIAKQEAAFGVFAGAVGQTASGAVSGALIGQGYGAIAGGVIGAASGIGGGIADTINLDKRIEETKSMKKDMYTYQLGNIKAMPYTMTKSNAFTATYKKFPFIEYFTCTDIEKEAFRNKLNYSGMTVMTIGTIGDYIQADESYIQANAIRLDSLADDTHMATEIADMMAQGLYIK